MSSLSCQNGNILGNIQDASEITDEQMNGLGLARHGNNWRSTKRVPTECIGHYERTILRKSTGCPDKRDAALVALRWHLELEEEFARIRAEGSKYKTAISDAEIEILCLDWLRGSFKADERMRREGHYRDDATLVAEGVVEAGTARNARLRSRAEVENSARGAIAGGGHTEAVQGLAASAMLSKHGYRLAEPDFLRVVEALSKRMLESVEAATKRDAGIVVPHPEVPAPPPSPKTEPKDSRGLRLSAVIARFMSEQDKAAPMFKKYKTVLELFQKIIGDRCITELRQLDIADCFSLICKLPPRWSDALRKSKVSLKSLADGNTGKTISKKTFAATYIAAIRPFLGFAETTYGDQGWPRGLSVKGIKYRGNVSTPVAKQRPFTPTELRSLFGSQAMLTARTSHATEHQFWFPLVGLFTGARVNEVCQLNPQSDIRQEDGIWVMDFTDVGETDDRVRKSIKNTVSRRVVPIHSKLLELGFLVYVDRIRVTGARLLFPQWPPSSGSASANAKKWFEGLLSRLGLRDGTPGKRISGYHAFRHTVTNRAWNLGIQNMRVILGHAGEGEVTAVERGYEGTLDIANKQKIIEQLTYDLTFEPPTD